MIPDKLVPITVFIVRILAPVLILPAINNESVDKVPLETILELLATIIGPVNLFKPKVSLMTPILLNPVP